MSAAAAATADVCLGASFGARQYCHCGPSVGSGLPPFAGHLCIYMRNLSGIRSDGERGRPAVSQQGPPAPPSGPPTETGPARHGTPPRDVERRNLIMKLL